MYPRKGEFADQHTTLQKEDYSTLLYHSYFSRETHMLHPSANQSGFSPRMKNKTSTLQQEVNIISAFLSPLDDLLK
jgi:hypothetical protein